MPPGLCAIAGVALERVPDMFTTLGRLIGSFADDTVVHCFRICTNALSAMVNTIGLFMLKASYISAVIRIYSNTDLIDAYESLKYERLY